MLVVATLCTPCCTTAPVGSSAASSLRIAHCITGGVRGFPNPTQSARLQRFVQDLHRLAASVLRPQLLLVTEPPQGAASEQQTRADLAATYRTLAKLGLNEGVCNHLTAMIPGSRDQFLVIQYGLSWSEVTADNLVLIDASGAILVWDACTAEPVAGSKPFARCHSAAVTALAFSGDGKSLVSVGGDAQHSVALWTSPRGDWTDPTLVSAQGSGTAPVYCAAWKAAPAPGLKSVAYDFVTGGGAGLSFWSIGGAGNLVPVQGRLGASGAAPDTITCAVAVGSQWVAGGASGTVTVWEGNAVVKVVAAAHGTSGATDAPTPVTDLRVTPGGTGCVSGGADGFVKVWDAVGKDGLSGWERGRKAAVRTFGRVWARHGPC